MAVAIVGGCALAVTAAITGGGALLVSRMTALHTLVNSRMTEMLDAVRSLGHADGVADEKARNAQAQLVARDEVQKEKTQ